MDIWKFALWYNLILTLWAQFKLIHDLSKSFTFSRHQKSSFLRNTRICHTTRAQTMTSSLKPAHSTHLESPVDIGLFCKSYTLREISQLSFIYSNVDYRWSNWRTLNRMKCVVLRCNHIELLQLKWIGCTLIMQSKAILSRRQQLPTD